jgi:signal transduction histidine kinase
MIALFASTASGLRFRTRLLLWLMLALTAIAGLSMALAQRKISASVAREMDREFQAELAGVQTAQEVRQAALAERCRALVRRPRIHAALEDDALDLLYPSAHDELQDLLGAEIQDGPGTAGYALRARFYRFLNGDGAVIPVPAGIDAGTLAPVDEAALSLPSVPIRQQLGYLLPTAGEPKEGVAEIITVPIFSTESGAAIATLVVGFGSPDLTTGGASAVVRRGISTRGILHLSGLSPGAASEVAERLRGASEANPEGEDREQIELGGAPHLLFSKLLNPGSLYPPAHEVTICSLEPTNMRQRQVRGQILGASALLLLAGYTASHFLSRRLSAPVEKLALVSAENLASRARAEAALEQTSLELQRAARFSADASHQLKTPLTVMRAGLEELLARGDFDAEIREEISALVHQTYRLAHVVEDLLLLSRMEAGRLQLDFAPLDLRELIDGWLDDLSATPDGNDLEIQCELAGDLSILGEKRYTSMILQNLLENARKYNQPGGRIAVTVQLEPQALVLSIANTGRTIDPASQAHIFERFHRGAVAENVPGHGLGLNLARELARLHGGDLWLARSDAAWTEFCVRFRLAPAPRPAYAPA